VRVKDLHEPTAESEAIPLAALYNPYNIYQSFIYIHNMSTMNSSQTIDTDKKLFCHFSLHSINFI